MKLFDYRYPKILYAIFFSTISFSVYAENLDNSSSFTTQFDVKHDVSIPLRDIPKSSENEININSIMPLLITPSYSYSNPYTAIEKDGALQTGLIKTLTIPLFAFQGIGLGLGSYRPYLVPPDTNGSAGLTQYVQWVNADIGVFNKATGQIVSGFPKPGNSVWKGFGGLCETTNKGDPIVKYDQLANRWVLTQFAYSGNRYLQCVAVSKTADATGSYYRYSFQFDSLNDYSKLGLWPDAYYYTANMYGTSTGPRVCAMERNAMLLGQPARIQCKQLSFNTTGTLLPADLDGKLKPPAGNPGYFLSFRAPSTLKLFRYHVDFNNSSNSTFVGPINISVANFAIACPNTAGASCASQPQTAYKLNTLSDRLMHRVAYRQFANYGSMLATHTVQGPAPASAPAIRWYELRFNSGNVNPIVYQQGTRAPDSASRFMGSIAMDKFGNIAVGYTLSSASTYPSLSMSYRLASDPLNTMNYGQRINMGTGSQTNPRWGDYSSMSIDPVDDCTFWYTNEYLKSTGFYNWSTYIGALKLPGC